MYRCCTLATLGKSETANREEKCIEKGRTRIISVTVESLWYQMIATRVADDESVSANVL